MVARMRRPLRRHSFGMLRQAWEFKRALARPLPFHFHRCRQLWRFHSVGRPPLPCLRGRRGWASPRWPPASVPCVSTSTCSVVRCGRLSAPSPVSSRSRWPRSRNTLRPCPSVCSPTTLSTKVGSGDGTLLMNNFVTGVTSSHQEVLPASLGFNYGRPSAPSPV